MEITPKKGFKGLIENWQSDLIAAISVALIALPLSLGIALAAGAPAMAGILSAIVGGVVTTFYRGGHISVNGPAKGVIAVILLGIALDKGFIESIDDPISKYLKTLKPKKNLDKRKDSITIRHLITMSAGWDCNDWDKKSKGQEDRVYKKNDWLQYTLDLPMINNPGEVSTYCSMGVILMTQIIEEASGMPIDAFAKMFLFDPLGITNLGWTHTSKKDVINSSKRLSMIPRDMAKIGKLILQKGEWKQQQIVSSAWIEEATTPKTKITGIDYGYLWWTIPFQLKDGSFVTAKVATGNGGQYIMVFSEFNIIAVFTGGAYNSQDDKIPFAIVKDVLLPTFTPD